MKKENYAYAITSSKTPEELYTLLLDPKQWWMGLYNETIKGKSQKLNDEFTFEAGDGVHYTKQKLIELSPNKKMTWLVTESKLSFLKNPSEWTHTKIAYDIKKEGDTTTVTFTHEGLVPEIECYNECSNAWTGYLKNLSKKLQ